MFGYIYATRNLVNGKRYVGKRQSTTFEDGYLGSGILFQRALRKYGIDCFEKELLAVAMSLSELNKLEKEFIKSLNAVASKEFYNLAAGGDGGNTWAYMTPSRRSELARSIQAGLSIEVRKRRAALTSARLTGRPKTASHRAELSRAKLGKPKIWTVGGREKYSLRRKAEVAAGIAVPPKGNAGNRDFRHTPESKAKGGDGVKQAHARAREEGRAYHSDEGLEILRANMTALMSPEGIAQRNATPGYRFMQQRRREAAEERYAELAEILKTKTLSEAAEQLGVTTAAIHRYAESRDLVVEKSTEYHDKVQKKREAAAAAGRAVRIAQTEEFWSPFDLTEMYKTMTQAQIAAKVGVSQVRVSQRMKQLGITKSSAGSGGTRPVRPDRR